MGGGMAYGTDAKFIDYLARTGREIPADIDATVARELGSMWVNSFETRFKSIKLSADQEDSFPRKHYNPTPVNIELAAYEAAFAYASGIDIFGEAGGQAGGAVTREKVGPLEVQYAAPEYANMSDLFAAMQVLVPMAYQYLLPYLRVDSVGGGPAAFVARKYSGGCC